MPAETLPPLKEVQLYSLETREATVGIDLQTGSIRSLVWKSNGMDLFAQLRGGIRGYAGCLRVYDELDELWFEDLRDEFTLRDVKAEGNTVSFRKLYAGAPFELTVTYTMDKGFLHWSVEGRKLKPNVADRSLRIYFLTPLIAGWEIWAPCYMGERTFDGMTPFEHCYLQIPYVSTGEVILPMFSTYNKAADVGYSILEPIDAQVPAAKFQFNNGDKCFTWRAAPKAHQAPMLETVNYYIGLVGDRPMKTEVMLQFHEGDWRPALGRVYERWKPFFVPKNDRMYEMEGMFDGFCIHWDPKPVKRIAATGGKLFEVHGHFSYYADYYQDGKDRWVDVIVLERVYTKMGGSKANAHEVWAWINSHSPQEIVALIEDKKPADYTLEEAEAKVFTTREFCRRRVHDLAVNGVNPFWYFNYTDGFRPMVEQRWPDSLCKNEDGSLMSSGWFMCHNMNSDPKYSFGQFQIESAKKIIKEHPKLAGFFLDCFRHFEIDFAHDDGITVANNRPAYSVNFSYDPIEAVIEKLLLKHNMCTFANKPQTIRSMRYVDGMMLEGDGDQMEEKYFWSCLSKPVIFLWTSDKSSDDENCRRALLHGCFPRVVDPWDRDKPDAMPLQSTEYQRRKLYMPLYEEFRRRVFCFEPDPIRVPKGCRGRLFTVGHDYVAGIANLNLDENTQIKYIKPLYAMFRVKRGHDITKVGVMVPGAKKFKFVKFQFNGTFVAVPLAGFEQSCVVKLFVTKKSGKKIGAAKFTGSVDSCGDPDSSFADTNNR